MKFSIVMAMDPNRLEQFKVTKQVYDTFPQEKEIIIPTRNYEVISKYLHDNKLLKDVLLIGYKHELGFNPSKALNIGTRHAQYDNIIITSPEVKPTTDVLAQLSELPDRNVVCQVWDEDETGNLTSLVNRTFRSDNPGMYFLAMFQKSDIEKINGWDEEFMKGYAYEDNDFGERWVRAGLPYEVREDIQAVHQYHPRSQTIDGGATINLEHYHANTDAQVTYCKNGLNKGILKPTGL